MSRSPMDIRTALELRLSATRLRDIAAVGDDEAMRMALRSVADDLDQEAGWTAALEGVELIPSVEK
jgi:hypothetical protein